MNFLKPPIFHSATSFFFSSYYFSFLFFVFIYWIIYIQWFRGGTHTHTARSPPHTEAGRYWDQGLGSGGKSLCWDTHNWSPQHVNLDIYLWSLLPSCHILFLSSSLLHSAITSLSSSYPLISSFPCFFSYPQDPVHFLPSIGYLSTYREPTEWPGLEKEGATSHGTVVM